MCGIVGYIGQNDAYPVLIEGLTKLEYRGYDSADVALINTITYIYNIRVELSAYGQVYEKVIFCIYGDSFRFVLNGVFHRLFI